MTISVVGFTTNVKVPGFFADTIFNAGPVSAGDLPLRLLLVGTKTSAGTATANLDVNLITSTTDADALYGPGSELAVMCYGALTQAGVRIYGAPVPEAGGAAAGTATITITGSWTAGGTLTYRIDGVSVGVTVLSTDTISTLADSIVSAVNSTSQLSVTAAKGAATAYVVTLTRKSKGARGNQGILFQDYSLKPSGLTSAIAGGSSVTGGGVFFTGGSGVDDVTTLTSSVINATQYDRIAAAENDATNAAIWKAFVNNQAAPLTGILEHLVVAVNSSFASAVSLAQTTYNAERVQLLWYLYSETIPSRLAATFASKRTATEQVDPDAAYDGYILPSVAPQSQTTDWPSMATLIAALNSGVTPVSTNVTGGAYVVRSITTHCQDSTGNPQYSTLDTSAAVVPDYVRADLKLYWLTVFLPGNPRVGPDNAVTQRTPPAGLATPDLWRRAVTGRLTLLEQASPSILIGVAQNPVVVEYNTVGKFLAGIVPVVPAPNQHQVLLSVRNVG